MRGTWQGSGTWQTSGLDWRGLVPVAIAVAIAIAVEFILSIIVWIAVALGVVLVLAAAGLVWWRRGELERKARYAALYAAAFEAHRRSATVTATVIPQAPAPSHQPAIHNHGPQFHFYGAASPEAVRVIRQALPGTVGEAITEEE